MSDEPLDNLIAQFRPRFGNLEDIRVAKMIGKRNALKTAIGSHEKTVKRLTKAVERKTVKERDLENVERSLLFALKKVIH